MTEENKGLSRRTVVKGAAWSVPVIAAAVATPLAAASVANSSLAWTSTETGLLALRVLDGGSLLNAQALVTVPDEFTLSNGTGAINAATATITVVVGRPGGINIPVGRARGFGVYSLDGAVVAAQNSTAYASLPFVGEVGFPITTFVGTHTFTAASNGSVAVPIEFGLSGDSTGVSIGALSSFPVSLTVDFGDGNVYSANSTITVPIGGGIL